MVASPDDSVMRFAVVIPAYDEVATIRDLAERALKQCPQVIVVDDGSVDGTSEALAGLPVSVLRNERNLGKAASLWRGAQQALTLDVQAVVTLDGDGQHAPEDIPRLMTAAEQHPDAIVIGARLADRHAIPKLRYFANRVAVFWVSWACGQRLDDSQSGFRVYPAKLFRQLDIPRDHAHSFVFESEMLIEAARHGHPCVTVPIAAVYRQHARPSHFRHIDTWHITRMVAWKLLSRGLYLRGLYRAFIQRRQPR
jgi:glycosyltransferase involved in cell wall biosynthesis